MARAFDPFEDTGVADLDIRQRTSTGPVIVATGTELRGRFGYRLESRLGRGQYGSVYLATCVDRDGPDAPPEQVAIKLFFPPHGSDPKDILKRELSALLALRNDRIPRVYDWSLDGTTAFVVLEYYPEGSLGDWTQIRGGLDEPATWRLLDDLLTALAAAHRACLLHLDVKPKNVLCDGSGGFVLSDFGISQGSLVSRSIIATGIGAPGYQAPEQRRKDHDSFDARTDLWGVGVTVWSSYTGIRLWERPDLILPETPENFHGLPRLSSVRPECSPALDELVMSLLVNAPEHRPGGANEVLARVQRRAKGEAEDAIIAPPDQGEMREVIQGLMDPLWRSVCAEEGFERHVRRYQDGDVLCHDGERSYTAFVLLSGKIRVERAGIVLATESREGAFLGEVTALAGKARTATLIAEGPLWVAALNAAELERLVTRNPAIGIRIIKTLAERLADEATRGRDSRSP